ncbi:MAG: hypothetical protein IPO55_06165 [Alphaproteobacteria bacterium]|nr:hypothetical protein [Alphaproteobacteria bacterium]
MNGEEDKAGTDNDFWQSKAGRTLTAEDHRQIRENLTGFFNILNEWRRKERGNVH